MSAGEHLREEQFMPITEFQKLKANDYDNGMKVGQLSRHDDPGYKWDKLSHDISKEGMKRPALVHEGTLYNGHHRAVVAMEQGALFVPVHSDFNNGENMSAGAAPYREY